MRYKERDRERRREMKNAGEVECKMESVTEVRNGGYIAV